MLFLSLLADWCRELVPIPGSCGDAIEILGDLRRSALILKEYKMDTQDFTSEM